MTIRSLAATAAVVAACLTSTAIPCLSGELERDQTVPFAAADLQNAAPNFAGISNWFNSAPLNMTDLRGKVVLVDFWTYGCVNCVNTLPHVTELYAKYRDRGLVVVGVHTPEFPFERSASNVQAALKRSGTTAKASTNRWIAPSRACSTPQAERSCARRCTIVTVGMVRSASE